MKFEPRNTRVTYNKQWLQQGFVKTTFSFNDSSTGWILVEDQVPLTNEIEFALTQPRRLAAIIHPAYDETVALIAVDPDQDMNLMCFYCGNSKVLPGCKKCGQVLCEECNGSAGCSCMIATGKVANMDSFVPRPGQACKSVISLRDSADPYKYKIKTFA